MMNKKNLSFKEAAYNILQSEDEPLSSKEIVDLAFQKDILKTVGKTPEATMAAQLYVDINKNKKTKFKLVGKGKFALIKQIESSTSPLILIDNQNSLVKKALMKKLYEMDPFQFEFLIADLLEKIGYESVQVTKRSGDKGIDVTANLTMDGITNVKTIIQAKRYKKGNNISGKVITQLRGSAEVDQRGLVITTSDFTKDAISESNAQKKMPVSLVNGKKLLQLLLKYNIGVKKESIEILSLNSEYFENEQDSIHTNKNQSTGKNRSLWPLPGGIDSYLETLYKYLQVIESGINTRADLKNWYLSSFDAVNSEKSANGYINVPKSMGLTVFNNNVVELTEAGNKFLKTKDKDFLYEVVSQNVLAFDDIVEYIKTSDNVDSEKDILEFLKENFDIEWSTFQQVNYRLQWLVNLGKIKKVEKGYEAI